MFGSGPASLIETKAWWLRAVRAWPATHRSCLNHQIRRFFLTCEQRPATEPLSRSQLIHSAICRSRLATCEDRLARHCVVPVQSRFPVRFSLTPPFSAVRPQAMDLSATYHISPAARLMRLCPGLQQRPRTCAAYPALHRRQATSQSSPSSPGI